MKDLKNSIVSSARQDLSLWEEDSGFLHFLSTVRGEVSRFNASFGFNIMYSVLPPDTIDGSNASTQQVGFILARENRLIPDRTYCLYSLLKNKTLHGYIGILANNEITTLREITSLANFTNPSLKIYDWLRALTVASCDKH